MLPAGITWGQYLRFTATCLLTMLAGSQIVHQYYKPMKNLNEYINKELKNLPEDVQIKIRKELKDEGILKS